MHRRQILLGAAVMAPAATLPGISEATVAKGNLRRRVEQVVERYGAAWNSSDMTAMAALYTPDVHWVNVVGMHWKGREEVDYAHRALFEQSFKGVASTLEEIESVVPIPGGGALAVVRWGVAAYRTPSGQISPASRTRMSLTLVPYRDRLLIAHGANIQIVEGAQRSDPVGQRRDRQQGDRK
ncbi:MAG: SgcJ/EcaC family oxidoreductase [Sphingomonadales bacterium]|nr:MAG: SgcJ/EcaC family oxidoreductase [Sphingomonadales bacterium]